MKFITEGEYYLSSHLICTQPGLLMKDQGWYHFCTTGIHEQRTSNHKWRTCSLQRTHNYPTAK